MPKPIPAPDLQLAATEAKGVAHQRIAQRAIAQRIEGVKEPKVVAQRLVGAHKADPAWLDAFLNAFELARATEARARTLSVWDLSQAEAARLFGVSRQAVGKWLAQGAPPDRAVALADLDAATDILLRYLKRERISAVVRRPIAARGGVSLLKLVEQGETRQVLTICREMFEFARAQGEGIEEMSGTGGKNRR